MSNSVAIYYKWRQRGEIIASFKSQSIRSVLSLAFSRQYVHLFVYMLQLLISRTHATPSQVLRIYVALALFQPYRDLEAGYNQSLKS